MYMKTISSAIKRLYVFPLVACMMITTSSGKMNNDYTIRLATDVFSNSVAINQTITTCMILNTPAPVIKQIIFESEEDIDSSIPVEDESNIMIEPITIETATMSIEEVIIDEPVIQQPVIVSIEDPISGEIDIVDTYDFSSVPLSDDLMKATIDHCEKFGIPISIALGLMDVESNFNPNAGSQSGCYGLMQLNHKYFNVYSDPAQQIYDGLEYLAENLEKYNGDMMVALNVYNAGHVTGNMSYSNKVMNDAAKWSEITGAPMT